jgi:hypothetical protein
VPLLAWAAPAAEPGYPVDVSVAEVRRLLAFLVRTAEENQARPRPRAGDALADHYVRELARFTLDQKLAPQSLLVALAIGLDQTDIVRSHRLTGWYLRKVESDGERQRRLKALGHPTLKERPDWLYHFAVSAGLTAFLGPGSAEQVGIWKELRDADGGSGFSFADLAADEAGICFARTLLDPGAEGRHQLGSIARGFRGSRHLPAMVELPEGFAQEELFRRYGRPGEQKFRRACEAVRRKVEALPAFEKLKKEP